MFESGWEHQQDAFLQLTLLPRRILAGLPLPFSTPPAALRTRCLCFLVGLVGRAVLSTGSVKRWVFEMCKLQHLIPYRTVLCDTLTSSTSDAQTDTMNLGCWKTTMVIFSKQPGQLVTMEFYILPFCPPCSVLFFPSSFTKFRLKKTKQLPNTGLDHPMPAHGPSSWWTLGFSGAYGI